jgi:hypothetical protein
MPRLASLLLVVAALPLSAQQTVTVQANVVWSAGTRVRSPWTGVAVTVPQGFQAAVDDEAAGIVMSDGQSRLIGVWAMSHGSSAALGEAVSELLGGMGIEGRLLAQPEARGDLTVARFAAATTQGTGSLIAALRQGAHGSALAVVALGQAEGAALEELATSIANGAAMDAPEARGWPDRAAGRRFTTTGTDFISSRGGVGDGRYNSRSRADLTLCRDGQYAYESETYSIMSVDGAGSMENTSRDGHQGRWTLVADMLGRALLALEASDGREFLWVMEETSDGAVVDGTGYRVEPGPC